MKVVPWEESATDHDEHCVYETMERLCDESIEVSWRWYPVCKSTDGNTSSINFLPSSQNSNPERSFESSVQNLWEKVHIAHESRLEYNWDVWGIEQFDGVCGCNSCIFSVNELYVDFEALKVDDEEENKYGGC